MFRFTIRDLLWLTVVVALAVLWQMEARERHRELSLDLRSELVDKRVELARAQTIVKSQKERLDAIARANGAPALVEEIESLKEQLKAQQMAAESFMQAVREGRAIKWYPDMKETREKSAAP